MLLGWLATGLGDVLHEVFPALIVSTTAYVAISLRSPGVGQTKVQQWFDAENSAKG